MKHFTPSQVDLRMMFVGTFDHAEAENTAAVMVKVLALNGDTWREMTFEELERGFRRLTDDPGPWRNWFNNPFRKIDMHDLVCRGFAEWNAPPSLASGISFTDVGIQRMGKWVTAFSLKASTDQPEKDKV